MRVLRGVVYMLKRIGSRTEHCGRPQERDEGRGCKTRCKDRKS